MKVGKPLEVLDPWVSVRGSYSQWASAAVKWIAKNFQCPQQQKIAVYATLSSESVVYQRDEKYAHIVHAQSLLCKHDAKSLGKLSRLMGILGIEGNRESWEAQLGDVLTAYLNEKQACALKKWRDASSLWTVNSRELYRYLRNLAPAKPVAVMMSDGLPSAVPQDIYWEFKSFWDQFESWPSDESIRRAWHMLDDKYAAFLPRHDFSASVTPKDMWNQLRTMKNTSPGLDAWTRQELLTLPIEAWRDFLAIEEADVSATSSLLYMYPSCCFREEGSGDPICVTLQTDRCLLHDCALTLIHSSSEDQSMDSQCY